MHQLTGAAVEDPDLEDRNVPFRQVPFCKYKGHTADLLDLSWSKVSILTPTPLFLSPLIFIVFLRSRKATKTRNKPRSCHRTVSQY